MNKYENKWNDKQQNYSLFFFEGGGVGLGDDDSSDSDSIADFCLSMSEKKVGTIELNVGINKMEVWNNTITYFCYLLEEVKEQKIHQIDDNRYHLQLQVLFRVRNQKEGYLQLYNC